jgi:hypothetical protein
MLLRSDDALGGEGLVRAPLRLFFLPFFGLCWVDASGVPSFRFSFPLSL